MPPAPKLDLNKLASDPSRKIEGTVSVKSPETEAEREHRLTHETEDARHERRKDLVVLIFVLIGITVILIVCVVLAISPSASPEDKKWSTAILASIVTLLMGYLVGKEKASKSI
jgi:cation transport ATPase